MLKMTFGSVRCEAGQKATGFIEVTNRVDGTPLGFPVVVVCGQFDGPVLLVDGGIHGDEHEGTLAIAEWTKEIDPAKLHGVIIGVPVMNVSAFAAMQRGNPRDMHSYDMNRFYPGRPKGYLTERVADTHNTVVGTLADMEITIHSGGNSCYLGETIFTGLDDKPGLELARAMGPDWEIILDTPRAAGSPMAAMLDHGKRAITVELGGCAQTMPGDLRLNVDTLKRSFTNVCRHYHMLEGEAEYASGYWRGKQNVVQASKSGMLDPNPAIPLKKPINKGDYMMRITDLYGEPVEEIHAPCDGVLFGFRTYPSVTTGDWTLFCGDATYQPRESS
jgi:predicted deacylase